MFFSLLDFKQNLSVAPLKRFLVPLFAFSGLLLFSYLINYRIEDNTFFLVSRLLQNILFFWIVTNIMNNNPITVYKVLLSLNIAILLSALLFLFRIGTDFDHDGRLTLFGENSNKIGLFAVFSILFIISGISENKQNYRKWRYLLLIFIIPLINMAAQTASRVTFFGLLLTVFLYFILKSKKNLSGKLLFFLFGGGVIFALYSYLMTFDVLSERLFRTYYEGSMSGRDIIWAHVLPSILEKPVFGIGINGYSSIISQLYGGFYSPHNVFIEIFAYSGLLGLIVFFCFLFQIAREGFNILRYDDYVLPTLFFFLILFVFLSGQGLETKVFWMIFAYLATCRIRITEQV